MFFHVICVQKGNVVVVSPALHDQWQNVYDKTAVIYDTASAVCDPSMPDAQFFECARKVQKIKNTQNYFKTTCKC